MTSVKRKGAYSARQKSCQEWAGGAPPAGARRRRRRHAALRHIPRCALVTTATAVLRGWRVNSA